MHAPTLLTAGDVIGCCIDLDAGEISFYRNGTPLGVAYRGVRLLGYFPAASLSYAERSEFNFGSRPFMHPVPGFNPIQAAPPAPALALCKQLVGCMARLARVVAASPAHPLTTGDPDAAAAPGSSGSSGGGVAAAGGSSSATAGLTPAATAGAQGGAPSVSRALGLGGLSSGLTQRGGCSADGEPGPELQLGWADAALIASALCEHLAPLLAQPYLVLSDLLPALARLHGRTAPHGTAATLTAMRLLRMVLPESVWEVVCGVLLEGLARRCSTSPLNPAEFPFSAAYPWLSLMGCLVRVHMGFYVPLRLLDHMVYALRCMVTSHPCPAACRH